ncbi:hypothetical protein AB0D57_36870, partial [Streptomyces sp. NPDC048275]|uniref:hypothetical protein n=1 Tax=Streptomyces sp. NPDC048275 TaxID=3155629 RepID=UPI00340448DC
MLAVIVALGVVVVVLMTRGSSDTPEKKAPTESGGQGTPGTPAPSLSIPSELPTELPSSFPSELPSELPSGFPSGLPGDLESLIPTLAKDEVPYYMLKTGECFNTSAGRLGQVAKRSCGAPHEAEDVYSGFRGVGR